MGGMGVMGKEKVGRSLRLEEEGGPRFAHFDCPFTAHNNTLCSPFEVG
jgi:hypothetical protein